MTGPISDNDKDDRLALGDSVRLRAAFGRLERPLTLYALRIVGDADRARGVVQETFARLLAAGRDVNGREPVEPQDPAAAPASPINGHLTQWLYTVCRNRALDVRRKERRMTRLTDLPSSSAATL